MLSYEIILAVMGMVFFLVLLFALVWSIMKKRTFIKLLPFFILPIIMVAYPTLKSIRVGDIILDIQAQSKIVENNPGDTSAVKKLEASLEQLKGDERLSNNSDALLAAARAEMVLGNYDSASVSLDKAQQADPNTAGIVSLRNELNQKIELNNVFINNVAKLKTQIATLKESPGDTESINKINHTLSEIKVPRYVKPDQVLTIAKAYAISGDKQQSLKIIDHVASAPNSEKRLTPLKDSIVNQTFQKQFYRHGTPIKITPDSTLHNKVIFKNPVIIRR